MASEQPSFPIRATALVAAIREMLDARGEIVAASVLSRSEVSIQATGYDNWDGGTYIWEVVLRLRPSDFAVLSADERKAYSDAIARAATELSHDQHGHSIGSVRIAPSLGNQSETLTDSLPRLLALRGLTLGRELGSGSYGRVFLATHDALGDARAVKLFEPSALVQGSLAKLDRALERFKREAQILARLRHPNVVRLFDAHLVGNIRFIVTDYCDGVTAKVLVERGRLSFDAAVAIVTPLLEALVEVHAAGVIHRDIAPKNVIVREASDPSPVLIDFGLSGLLEAELADRLTTTALGTPGFSAPELVSDPTCQERRVDVYSMGALLHYLMTGRPPNHAEPTKLLLELGVEPRRVSVIEIGFAAQAARRYPSAQAFLDALRGTGHSSRGTVQPAVAPAIDEESLLQLLGATPRPELASLLGQAHLAFVCAEPEDYVKERLAYVATLLCGTRQLVDVLAGRRWSDSWQGEDELVPAVAQLIALRRGTAVADEKRARDGLARATQLGWLTESEYDAWKPGMQSGSGMRSRYQVSTLGKQLVAKAGVELARR
ncbi:MAG: serine/threonine-protein kinase [Myxococcaceae bacterium]